MNKNKKIFFLILLFLIIASSLFIKFRVAIYQNSPEKLKIIYKIILGENTVYGEREKGHYIVQKTKNDYNVKFLPDTQFIKLDLKKQKLNLLLKNENDYQKIKYKFLTFYIEVFDDKIWIIEEAGNFFEIEIKNIEKNIKQKQINSNLLVSKILDTYIYNENIYISYYTLKDNCKNLKISFAKISNEYLDFKNFYSAKECGKYKMYGGKMQHFVHNNVKGLLVTTADTRSNYPTDRPQNETSIFGKILFIDFNKKKPIIYSRGHRNAAGLYAKNNLILSTEHGPRGGDEINKIIFDKNYGWPISSYGEKYGKIKKLKPDYLKNHSLHGFGGTYLFIYTLCGNF